MLLPTKLRREERDMLPRGVTYEAFDAIVNATTLTKNDLQFEADLVRT